MYIVIFVIILIATTCGLAARAEPAGPRTCYSTAETRDKIVAHGLSDPFRILRGAAGSMQAEAIGVKLCGWNEALVYEISLLRRDGYLIHVFIDAKTGQVVGSRNER